MHQTVSVDVRIVNVGADGIAAFAEIMRRHVGGHTYGNTCRSVQQQERRLGRQHCRLLYRIIEVQLEVYGILLHVAEDIIGKLFQLGLGVSHGSDRVTVHGTEVTLTIYERISLVPVLCKPCHRIIYAGVAMRVEFTQNLSDDSR